MFIRWLRGKSTSQMLAELAACNAAFTTVKSFLQNGRSLADCASQIGTIVASKSALEERVHKKRSGFMAQLKQTQAQDLEEFLALEKIKETEEQLMQVMIYQGRAGLKEDWLNYQAEARRKRKEERRRAERERQEFIEATTIAGVVLLGLCAAGAVIYFFITQ